MAVAFARAVAVAVAVAVATSASASASASASESAAVAVAVAVAWRPIVPSEVWAVRGGLLRGGLLRGSSRSGGGWVEASRRPPEQLSAERRLVPRLALQQELDLPLLELSERAVRG